MRIRSIIYFCLFSAVCVACGKKIRPSEVSAYIHDPANGYVLKTENPDLRAECIYMPVQALVVNNLRTNNISKKEFRAAEKEFGGSAYFHLKLGYKSPPSDEIKSFVNFGLQNYVKLIIGGDTISANSYHAEPYNGVSPYHQVMVGFPVKNIGSKKCRVGVFHPDPVFENIIFSYNEKKTIKPFQLQYH